MPPGWKLKREVGRIWQQARGLAERFTDPVGQRRLDQIVAEGLPMLQGAQAASNRIALFLIFQPDGLHASTLETCRWLANHDYAPFIVSNAPIRPQDRAALAAAVWRAVERPNFGYDFGGYRDGLTTLGQWKMDPDEVLILNDSIWLPVLPQTDLIERLSRQPADIAGTIMWQREAVCFLESYLFRVRGPALRHSAFLDYWAGLRLTSNKYHVVRRGERGFSHAMLKAGIKIAAVYPHDELAVNLAAESDEFLRRTLEYAAYIDDEFAAGRDRLRDSTGANWRAEVLEHIHVVGQARPAYSSFPYAMAQLWQYPIVKKSAEPVSRNWRRAHLAAVEAGDLPRPSAAVLDEMRRRSPGNTGT